MNQGYIMDIAKLSRRESNIASYSSEDFDCELLFVFIESSVEVSQEGTCGFGHAVYADGDYQLVDDNIPILGCLSLYNPCD